MDEQKARVLLLSKLNEGATSLHRNQVENFDAVFRAALALSKEGLIKASISNDSITSAMITTRGQATLVAEAAAGLEGDGLATPSFKTMHDASDEDLLEYQSACLLEAAKVKELLKKNPLAGESPHVHSQLKEAQDGIEGVIEERRRREANKIAAAEVAASEKNVAVTRKMLWVSIVALGVTALFSAATFILELVKHLQPK